MLLFLDKQLVQVVFAVLEVIVVVVVVAAAVVVVVTVAVSMHHTRLLHVSYRLRLLHSESFEPAKMVDPSGGG